MHAKHQSRWGFGHENLLTILGPVAGDLHAKLILKEKLRFLLFKKDLKKIFFANLSAFFKSVHIDVAHLNCMRGNSESAIKPWSHMPRRACTFRQRDVTKLIRATTDAGLDIARVEVAEGRITVFTGNENAPDDLDRELENFEARHGQG